MASPGVNAVLRNRPDPFPGASFGADFRTGRYKLGRKIVRSVTAIPGWTFTRASTGYAETAAGALVSFASGVPRITEKGFLAEEQRVNYALRSQEFDNATYTKTNMAVTADDTLAPDGTQTADKVYVSSVAGGTTTYQNVTPGAGTTITASLYAKKGTSATVVNEFGIRDATAATTLLVFTVNYDTLAVTYSTGASGVTVTQLANGWVRIQMVLSWTSGNTCRVYCGYATGTKTLNDYAYMWGLQVEIGAFPTSYIPTTTASATRAADVAYISGTDLVPTLAGTLVFKSAACLWESGPDRNLLDWNSGNEGLARFSGGSIQLHDGVGYRTSQVFATAGVAAKYAVSYGGTAINSCLNGGSISSYNSFDGALTSNTKLSIGCADGGNAQWTGYIQQVLIYPSAFTNAQLIAATT